MNFKTYLKEAEEQAAKPKSVAAVIDMLKKLPKAKDWAVKGAKGDDVQFEIPEGELKKTIGMTYEDLQKLEKANDHDKGGVNLDDGVVSLYGEDEKNLSEEKLKGWVAIYNRQKLEITTDEADGISDAKQLAIKHFKIPKSKQGLLSIAPGY